MLKCKSVASWLEQFSSAELHLAVKTLEHLRFVPSDEVKHDLSVTLGELVDESVLANSNVIIESILSKEDIERFLLSNPHHAGTGPSSKTTGRSPALFSTFASSALSQETIAEALDPLPRRSQPTRCLYGHYFPSEVRDEDAGSEKYLDLVARNEYRRLSESLATRDEPFPLFRGRTGIKALIETNGPIVLILITDNIGSGTQVIDFLSSVLLSSSLGPLSGREISVTVLAWTASRQGITSIERWANDTLFCLHEYRESGIPLSIHCLRYTETFFDIENEALRRELLEFFKKYGDPTGAKSSKGLGFGGTASSTVMLGSSCPNNVPDFLYCTSNEAPGYEPLFKSQILPDDIVDYFQGQTPQGAPRGAEDGKFLQLMERESLIQAARRPGGRSDVAWRVLLCAVAGYDKWAAMRALQISSYRFRQAQTALVQLEWITPSFIATDAGRTIVKTFGLKGTYADFASARRYLKRQVDARLFTYYPRAVRGVS